VNRNSTRLALSSSPGRRAISQSDDPFLALALKFALSLALAGSAAFQASPRAQAANPQPTTDLDFRSAIARIVASADHDFTDIAGAKISNEYKTALRIKYRGSTYGGLIVPADGGGWSCTFPVLLTLDRSEADAAFAEWTAALTSAFAAGRLLPADGSGAAAVAHSNLERVAADAPLSIWGAERGSTRVRLFYTMNRDDQSYYIEVMLVHRAAARQ
jgi:hypothetical protein